MHGIYPKSRKSVVRKPLIQQVSDCYRNLHNQQRMKLNVRVTSCLQAVFKHFAANKLWGVGWLAKTNNIQL